MGEGSCHRPWRTPGPQPGQWGGEKWQVREDHDNRTEAGAGRGGWLLAPVTRTLVLMMFFTSRVPCLCPQRGPEAPGGRGLQRAWGIPGPGVRWAPRDVSWTQAPPRHRPLRWAEPLPSPLPWKTTAQRVPRNVATSRRNPAPCRRRAADGEVGRAAAAREAQPAGHRCPGAP